MGVTSVPMEGVFGTGLDVWEAAGVAGGETDSRGAHAKRSKAIDKAKDLDKSWLLFIIITSFQVEIICALWEFPW